MTVQSSLKIREALSDCVVFSCVIALVVIVKIIFDIAFGDKSLSVELIFILVLFLISRYKKRLAKGYNKTESLIKKTFHRLSNYEKSAISVLIISALISVVVYLIVLDCLYRNGYYGLILG